MKFIDNFLNSITMYRLVLYGLMTLAVLSILFGFFGIISWNGFQLLASLVILQAVCLFTNFVFAKLFKAFTNTESAMITALILFFLLAPPSSWYDLWALLIGGAVAMASKYILAIHKRHVFNPAGFGAFFLDIIGFTSVIWWVATPALFPFILIIGLLIVKKIRRFNILVALLAICFPVTIWTLMQNHTGFLSAFATTVISWPHLFFGTIMVTEPLTGPSENVFQIIYAVLIGILTVIPFSFGPFYTTPELALMVGNIFALIVNFRQKRTLTLTLKEKKQLSADTFEFIFHPDQKLAFQAGQYLEWTLPHHHVDNRGNRRYFTIASSPTENELHLGVRINPGESSSFKKTLLNLKEGDKMLAGSLAGSFTMPKDKTKKMVFIAGGIGITPFRSMIAYLMDTQEKRDVVVFYNSTKADNFAYEDVLSEAEKKVGVKTHYIVSTKDQNPNWKGKTGYITPQMIQEEVPDYKERHFYLSGPNAMVQNYRQMLLSMGIKRKDISTDYFPGF